MPAFPVHIEDARGQRVRLERAPRRIVSLVPSQTELLAYLGLDHETVGLTRFCVRPEGWKERKAIVGGTKQVHLDDLKALQPDLVLTNREENTQDVVEALASHTPVFVTEVKTVLGSSASATSMIRTVGRLTGRAHRAERLATRLETRFRSLTRAVRGGTPSRGETPPPGEPDHEEARRQPPLPVAYLIWRDPYMTVGRDTIIHDVLQRAGLQNVFADRTRYPEVTPADLAASDARVVLLPDEPFPFDEEYAEELRAALPQPLPTNLVVGALFSWYGPRLADAPPYLRTLREELLARCSAP